MKCQKLVNARKVSYLHIYENIISYGKWRRYIKVYIIGSQNLTWSMLKPCNEVKIVVPTTSIEIPFYLSFVCLYFLFFSLSVFGNL